MSGPAVQRWRVTYARRAAAATSTARAALEAWESAIAASTLPIATEGDGARPRLQAGPPPPPGVVAEEELVDLYLAERRTRADVREALEPIAPAGVVITDLADVWIRAPSPAASVVAADYRIPLAGIADPDGLARAIRQLLESEHLVRERDRAGRVTSFDLRRLIVDVWIADQQDGQPDVTGGSTLGMRLRLDPQLGNGRPDDVLAALREASGLDLVPSAPAVRGRLELSAG
jgi:uncharacterized protein (DUF2344 family)